MAREAPIGQTMFQKKLDDHKARIVIKESSTLMHAIALVLWPFVPDFMGRFVTTIGRTIYVPGFMDPYSLRSRGTMRHELVHVAQWNSYWILHPLSYLLFPVPILLAWGRWRWEREAYMVQLRRGDVGIEAVVSTLWRNYLWPWPKAWMRRWFERELGVG